MYVVIAVYSVVIISLLFVVFKKKNYIVQIPAYMVLLLHISIRISSFYLKMTTIIRFNQVVIILLVRTTMLFQLAKTCGAATVLLASF